MARLTEYQENYPQQVLDYLKTVGDGTGKLPKREDIALMFDVTLQTIQNWAGKYELFGTAIARVDLGQRAVLQDDGMYGGKEVNHQMAKFLLSANHGMVETERKELTGANGAPLSFLIEGVSGKKENPAS